MTQKVTITAVICILVTLTGCKSSQQEKPLWGKYKITDLAVPPEDSQGKYEIIQTANFEIYIVELPADNIEMLNDIWQNFQKKNISFNNPESFRANSFLLGRGDIKKWDELENQLRKAKADLKNKTSVFISENQSEDISIDMLPGEKNVFYVTLDGTMAGATIGPGMIGFRIKTKKILYSTGICELEITPLSVPPQMITLMQSEKKQEQENEVLFQSAGFELTARPGDFLLLGTEKFDIEKTTLNSLFFCREKPEPIIRIYIILCAGVNF